MQYISLIKFENKTFIQVQRKREIRKKKGKKKRKSPKFGERMSIYFFLLFLFSAEACLWHCSPWRMLVSTNVCINTCTYSSGALLGSGWQKRRTEFSKQLCGVRCGLCLVLTSWQVKKRNRENCTAICIIGVYSIENRVLHFVERWKTSVCFFSKRAFGPRWDPNGIQAGPRLGSNERASSRNVVYQAQFLLECKYRFSFPYSAQRKKKKKLRQQDIRQREWRRKKKYFRRSIQATCIIIEQ